MDRGRRNRRWGARWSAARIRPVEGWFPCGESSLGGLGGKWSGNESRAVRHERSGIGWRGMPPIECCKNWAGLAGDDSADGVRGRVHARAIHRGWIIRGFARGVLAVCFRRGFRVLAIPRSESHATNARHRVPPDYLPAMDWSAARYPTRAPRPCRRPYAPPNFFRDDSPPGTSPEPVVCAVVYATRAPRRFLRPRSIP